MTRISQATKPHTWAQKATPQVPVSPIVPIQEYTCVANQYQSIKNAGRVIFFKNGNIMMVSTFAWGYKSKYHHITQAIAPDAPIFGIKDVGSEYICNALATSHESR